METKVSSETRSPRSTWRGPRAEDTGPTGALGPPLLPQVWIQMCPVAIWGYSPAHSPPLPQSGQRATSWKVHGLNAHFIDVFLSSRVNFSQFDSPTARRWGRSLSFLSKYERKQRLQVIFWDEKTFSFKDGQIRQTVGVLSERQVLWRRRRSLRLLICFPSFFSSLAPGLRGLYHSKSNDSDTVNSLQHWMFTPSLGAELVSFTLEIVVITLRVNILWQWILTLGR